MTDGLIEPGWPLGALLVGLAVAAALVVRAADLGPAWVPVTAAVRAGLQLAAVSLVIAWVLRSMPWTLAFVAVMVLVAAATSARRITQSLGLTAAWFVLPIVAGVLPPVVLALLTDVVPLEPVAVLPTAGILVGGAMTATTLAGQLVLTELRDQHGQYEAARVLGMSHRQAVDVVARPRAALALVPGQDQTRTVGLVTLPGAFVGVLLAGETPLAASAAQAFVLIALLLVQAVAAAVTVELIGLDVVHA